MNDLLIIDLIHNQDYFKVLVKDLTAQLKENLVKNDPVMHNDIYKNYYEIVKSTILQDVTKRIGINAEDAMIILENVNWKDYLI